MVGTADALYGTAKYKEAVKLFEKAVSTAQAILGADNRLAEIYHKKLNDTSMAIKDLPTNQSESGITSSDAAYKTVEQKIKSIEVEIRLLSNLRRKQKSCRAESCAAC